MSFWQLILVTCKLCVRGKSCRINVRTKNLYVKMLMKLTPEGVLFSKVNQTKVNLRNSINSTWSNYIWTELNQIQPFLVKYNQLFVKKMDQNVNFRSNVIF